MRRNGFRASQFGTALNAGTQITVRFPEEIVAFVDEEVRVGRAKSSAQVVLRALEREQRRQLAVRDVEILASDSVAGDRAATDAAVATAQVAILERHAAMDYPRRQRLRPVR